MLIIANIEDFGKIYDKCLNCGVISYSQYGSKAIISTSHALAGATRQT